MKGPIDSIDPVSGKLHFQIPLASLPPGPAGFGFNLGLVYDSHLYDGRPTSEIDDYDELTEELKLWAHFTTGGWNYNFKNFKIELEERLDSDFVSASSCRLLSEYHRIYRLRVGLPDGGMHTLHLRGFGDTEIGDPYYNDGFYGVLPDGTLGTCADASDDYTSQVGNRLTYYTSDSSHLKLEIDTQAGEAWYEQEWTLYFPDGRRVVGINGAVKAMYDAKGNGVYFENICRDVPLPAQIIFCDDLTTEIKDDFDRKIVITYNVPLPSGSTRDGYDPDRQDHGHGPCCRHAHLDGQLEDSSDR